MEWEARRPAVGERRARLIRRGTGTDGGRGLPGPEGGARLVRLAVRPATGGRRREAVLGAVAGLLAAAVALGVWAARPATWTSLAAVPPPVGQAAWPEVLAYSPDGVLTAAMSAGVWQLRHGRWTQLAPGELPAGVAWSSLAFGPGGTIAVGGPGAWMFTGGRWSEIGAPRQLRQPVHALAFTSSGTLLAGTEQGVWRFAGGTWSHIAAGLPTGPAPVPALAVSAAGTAAVIGGGLWVRPAAGAAWRRLPAPPAAGPRPVGITAIGYLGGGKLVAGTTAGVWEYAGGTWSELGGADSPLAGAQVGVLSIAAHRIQGVVTTTISGYGSSAVSSWVWRWRSGAWVLAGGTGAPVVGDRVQSLTSLPGGALAAATMAELPACRGAALQFVVSDGIWTDAGGGWTQIPGAAPALGGVSALLATPGGGLLAGTRSGVYRDVGGAWSNVAGRDAPPMLGSVASLAVSPSGALTAVGTSGAPCPAPNQLWRLVGGAWTSMHLPAQAGHPAAAAYSPTGTLVIAAIPDTGSVGGVWTLGPAGWAPVGGPASPLVGASVQSVVFSRSGTLLAGGSRGVWAWRRGAWSAVGGTGTPTALTGLAVCPSGQIVAANGNVWAFDGHVWRTLGDNRTNRPSIDTVACGRHGTVYGLGFPTGVWRLTPGGWSPLAGGPRNADALDMAPDGALLAGGAGISSYQPHG